jgi:hypothetical protein
MRLCAVSSLPSQNELQSFLQIAFVEGGASEAVGLDLAPTAAVEANSYVKSVLGAEAGKGRVVEGNFMSWNDPQGPFDLG